MLFRKTLWVKPCHVRYWKWTICPPPRTSAALSCAEIGISMPLSGLLLPLRPHPGWSGCELRVSLCISLSTSLSLFSYRPCLWFSSKPFRLGNIRKPRLCFWCTQLCGNSAYCFRLLLKAGWESVDTYSSCFVLPGIIPGSVDTKRGCKHEGSLGHGKNIFKLTFIYYLML